MADSTTHVTQITSGQGSKEVTMNGLIDALSPALFGARRAEACAALTWGYYGGRWSGSTVANGTLSLTASSTNYIVCNRSTGAITGSTSTTNWNVPATYARLYEIVAGSSSVTSYTDHRNGPSGIITGETATAVSPIGRHAVPISAGSMRPSVAGGCANLIGIASASNQPDIVTLNFDASTQEYAQFSIAMPESWDQGSLTFVAHWSHPATTTNFGVVWNLQAVAIGDGEAIATAFGTAQQVADTGGSTDSLYITAESPSITVAGVGASPNEANIVFFRLSRVTGDGSDTMAVDARLHGITLYMTTDAATDE